jgi:protein SCO1/2
LALFGCERRSATNESHAAGAASVAASAVSAPAASSVGTVPPFHFVDQYGHATTDAGLRGHVWIFDFVYTSCTSVCPTLTAKLVLLERRLADPDLRFVSFSVDPEHDTPEALAHYAAQFRPDEQRWHLLATDTAGLERFARGVGADVRATGDPNDPVRHSAAFFLVDRNGALAGSYDSGDPSALARLRADAARLTGDGASRPDETATHLVASLGCDGCHARSELAPPLVALGGQPVALSDGRQIVRDEAYLRESLLEPGAKLVRGYPDRMPAYGAELSSAELDALVVSLMHLPPAPPAPHRTSSHGDAPTVSPEPRARTQAAAPAGSAPDAAEAEMSVDAVCGMDVHVGAKTPRAVFAGRRYFFCSDVCRETFEKAPQKFVH